MAVQVAAPSSLSFTSETEYRYDVFLSFRGEDTRHSFTVILYDALRRKGINAFIDDKKLGKGERIAPSLLKAIERSRVSIVVFSTNYATSTWCLDELAHIIRCKKEKNHMVMPIFYKVDPMDVQYQRNSFGEAMAAHEDRFRNDLEKVQKWRSALSETASLSSAWLFGDGYEFGFIQRIVEEAYSMLPPKRLHNTDHMVGLEPRKEEVTSLLDECDDGVCMLGIHGTGGVGKTTLARAVYNSIFYQFEGACFLFDVKEASKKYQGIVCLQQTLLSETLEEKRVKFGSADEGISRIKHRLSHKRVLLVLDDVDEVEQLEKLAGGCDWFGWGSKVIITTRNQQLLIACNVEKTYEMKELDDHDSLELFCWHAFHMSQPPEGYHDMSCHVVISYARGLPLALRLIGANLAHKNLEEWRSTLKQYDCILERSIHEVLKISYHCLQDGAKSIFLDIACFFGMYLWDSVEEIVEACDSGGRFYIEVLVDKSLISIDDKGHLYMHGLIKQMGREIVRNEAPLDPCKRSRLWYYKDVLKVLCENLGSSNIEGIMLDPPQQEDVKWSSLSFEKMTNLRILIIRKSQFSTSPKHLPNSLKWLEWEGYPSSTLPLDFSPRKLVFFKLCCSPFRLDQPLKRFEFVTYMNFSQCEFITEIPEMSQFQSLTRLLFKDCCNLIKVHDSVGSLSMLMTLNVRGCIKLTGFPREIKMPSLQSLDLSNCKSLDYFPRVAGNMDALKCISANETAIKELPPCIGNLPSLELLNIRSCKSLRDLPNSLLALKNINFLILEGTQRRSRKSLKKLMHERPEVVRFSANLEFLNLSYCGLLDEDLHLTLNIFQNLEQLNLSGNNDLVSLPGCIKECAKLVFLTLNNCKRLRHIPELPLHLNVQAENCTSLTNESSGHIWSQAKNEFFGMGITMPATTTAFPDWFHNWCEGGKLCFRARGSNFPHAFEVGKANTNERFSFDICMSTNGHAILKTHEGSLMTQGHVHLYHIVRTFEGAEDLKRLQIRNFHELDWNDVEIQVTCLTPNMPVVRCGVYVYTQHSNMENLQFKSSQLSMNAPTSSLKRRANASNEPPSKFLKKFNNSMKGTRRVKRHRIFLSCRKRKIVFPVGKHVWRLMYYNC